MPKIGSTDGCSKFIVKEDDPPQRLSLAPLPIHAEVPTTAIFSKRKIGRRPLPLSLTLFWRREKQIGEAVNMGERREKTPMRSSDQAG